MEAFKLLVRTPGYKRPSEDVESCEACIQGCVKPIACVGFSTDMPICNAFEQAPFWMGLASILPDIAHDAHEKNKNRIRSFLAKCSKPERGLLFAPNGVASVRVGRPVTDGFLPSMMGRLGDRGTDVSDIMERAERRIIRGARSMSALFARLDKELGID